ncbi:hypothetical protein B0I27_107119 [Arcticibacter pallidicorallinus]|uniref:Uncharacterized protein n=1 Tax=Arcticibacter pallidicorallinus TaxID=1259464 RepID=A0A2T0U0W2_9SPHI|nr:hypothetical protein [Arcticibacter pallidicorallinus]PRY51533.1 hypothetical protein B0I27_107119 [Arcticibacter pallidicorallinus]
MKTIKVIILLLVIALAGLGWYCYQLSKAAEERNKESPIAEIAKKQIQTEAKKIAEEVDKNGLQHTVYRMVKEIDQEAIDKVRADLLDTVAQLNITRDKLKQVMVVATSLQITNQKLEKKINSEVTTYTHTDPRASLSVFIPRDSTQSATFNFKYDADLVTTQYKKRNWFLGANHSYIDIYSNDPRVTIQGARTLTVKQKQPELGLRLQGQFNLDPETLSYGVGPGIRVDLGRLSVQAGYLHYPRSKASPNWKYSVGANYDFIRF